MVVSGVPKTNENEHSSEICTMALDVLREVTEIRIPHMPNEHLLMRVGVHTGKNLHESFHFHIQMEVITRVCSNYRCTRG
jgi:hypothetical protein